ncbi:MAG: type II toxin-antitoxin system RelE/ParE family toxin [Gemmataceae bacterium]|nr:type II toxin-antitoxin system RelE/ParE family toxin [Gemmataceae bacterium]
MTGHWTATALAHLEAIRDYLARNSPGYAQAVVDRLIRRTEGLDEMPMLGAPVPEYDNDLIREILEHPYRIIYRTRSDRVEILAVIHGARQLPRTPPG